MPTALIHGRVRAAGGEAVGGAEIRYELGAERPCGHGVAHSQADGGYRIALSWAGPDRVELHLEIRAVARRLARYGHGTAELLCADEERQLDFELADGLTVELEVVDDAGRPVAGAKSDVIENNLVLGFCGGSVYFGIPSQPRIEPRTDERGRFTWHGLPRQAGPNERHVVSVAHPHHAEALFEAHDLDATDGVAWARVQLARGAALEGRVSDVETGAPLGDVELTTYHQDDSGAQPPCHAVTQSTRSDASGRYRLVGLRPGRHVLRVSGGDHIARLIEDVEVAAAGSAFDVALARGVRVSGHVIGPDGHPAADLEVRATWDNGRVDRPQVSTDASGRFALEGVPAGVTLDVYARKPAMGWGEAYGFARVTSGTDDLAFDARERAFLGGRIVDGEGRPIALRAHAVARNLPGDEITATAWPEVLDGSFELLVLPGRVELLVTAIDAETHEHFHLRTTLDLAPRERRVDMLLTALPSCPLHVEVVDAETRAPIAGASVDAMLQHTLSGNCHIDTTGADGRVCFPYVLRDEDVTVHAGAAGYQRGVVGGVQVPRDDRVVVALTRHL